MNRVIEWLIRQFDPSEEPVRLAVFAVLVVAGLAHAFFPSVAEVLDAVAVIVAGAWARAKVSPVG